MAVQSHAEVILLATRAYQPLTHTPVPALDIYGLAIYLETEDAVDHLIAILADTE
jgi:hypothetical protein